jgi:hypothetical protein
MVPLKFDHFRKSWPSTSANRILSWEGGTARRLTHLGASGVDGTASLTNRDFGRVLRANQQKVVFSGAAKSENDAAIARYFGVLRECSQR